MGSWAHLNVETSILFEQLLQHATVRMKCHSMIKVPFREAVAESEDFEVWFDAIFFHCPRVCVPTIV